MGYIGQASNGERGATGNVAGNQTGRELNIRGIYSLANWNWIIKCPDRQKALYAAQQCVKGVKNQRIGYDQGGRETARHEAAKVGYQLDKITTPCETDCSAFVSLCYVCAGYTGHISKNWSPSTYALDYAFGKLGFTVIPRGNANFTFNNLEPGDILLRRGHTAMYLGDDPYSLDSGGVPIEEDKEDSFTGEYSDSPNSGKRIVQKVFLEVNKKTSFRRLSKVESDIYENWEQQYGNWGTGETRDKSISTRLDLDNFTEEQQNLTFFPCYQKYTKRCFLCVTDQTFKGIPGCDMSSPDCILYCDSVSYCNSLCDICQSFGENQKFTCGIKEHPNVGVFPIPKVNRGDLIFRFWNSTNWNSMLSKINKAQYTGLTARQMQTLIEDEHTKKEYIDTNIREPVAYENLHCLQINKWDPIRAEDYNHTAANINIFLEKKDWLTAVNKQELITAAKANALKTGFEAAKFNYSVCDTCNTKDAKTHCNCPCSCACNCACNCACPCSNSPSATTEEGGTPNKDNSKPSNPSSGKT